MIALAMAYSSMVAVLLSGAGYALERAAALCGIPRRGVWAVALLASWILPLAMMAERHHPAESPIVPIQQTSAQTLPESLVVARRYAATISPARWLTLPALDEALTIVWGSMSCGLLIIWGVAAVRLSRRAKLWPIVRIDGAVVSISDRCGPAVLGYLRPRIVMPNAILSQSKATQSIALKHEQSHIAADDPALLLFGLLLVILAPWNVALWWQLRRLRFAIEVDCDARVLKCGVGAAAYGETLLSISHQDASVPLGMVALTEPTSQLERRVRIMMTGPARYRKVLMGLSLSVATSLVLVASGLSAPTVSDSSGELRKPLPAQAGAPPEKFVALIRERYPALANHSDKGTPVLLVLFNDDGTVARTEKDLFKGSSLRDFDGSSALSSHFGMKPEHVGAQALDFGSQTVLVVYTDKGARHIPFTSSLFPDSRIIDRALAERFFPSAFEHGVSAGEGIWVLFDRNGKVLRTGQEAFEPAQLIPILEARYPGIKSNDMTVTPVVDANMQPIKDRAGGGLKLYSVWLDEGSPLPGA